MSIIEYVIKNHYFFFLNSKLNRRQTAAYTRPATAAIEYTITRAGWLGCNVIRVAPSYGTPPVIIIPRILIRGENIRAFSSIPYLNIYIT